MSITFSTCWYKTKAKFDIAVYERWIKNFLFVVDKCNIVIYTNDESNDLVSRLINKKNFTNVKVIKKPFKEFYNYKYLNNWENNHKKNIQLNKITSWYLNMLWCEKVHFVKETMDKKYFDTEYYGWCDIGYFRNRLNDTNVGRLSKWPNSERIRNLNKDKIYYACINNNDDYIQQLFRLVMNKNSDGLPINKIPPNQLSIAGGFFIGHRDKITWWRDMFDNKLNLYFKHDELVKDDQIIIADCVFSNLKHFHLCKEKSPNFDNWFLFQRFLL